MLSSLLSGNFGQNFQMPNFQNLQNFQNNGQNNFQNNGQNNFQNTSPTYAQSFPEEAYQNQDFQNNNQSNIMPQNMLSLLASALGKNADLSSLSSIFTAQNNSKNTEKKSSPIDDEIII